MGCTPNPSAQWVTQQARHLTWTLADLPESFRFLIRDRDQKFTASFDEVFRSDGIQIIRTPFRAPQANGGGGAVRTHRSLARVRPGGVTRFCTLQVAESLYFPRTEHL